MDPTLKCPSMLSSPLDNNTGSHYSYFALGIRAVEMAWEFAEGPFRAKVGALCEMGKFLWVQKIRTVASQRFHKKTRVVQHSIAQVCHPFCTWERLTDILQGYAKLFGQKHIEHSN